MAARVVFTAGFSRWYTGGVRKFTVEAKNPARASSRRWNSSTPAWAITSRRKPPSRSTARSTRPLISSRSARAARSSSSPSSQVAVVSLERDMDLSNIATSGNHLGGAKGFPRRPPVSARGFAVKAENRREVIKELGDVTAQKLIAVPQRYGGGGSLT